MILVVIEHITMNFFSIVCFILYYWMIIKVRLIIGRFHWWSLFDLLETNRILIDIDRVQKIAERNGNGPVKEIELVLDLCTAIRRKNYIRFFVIYRSLPPLVSSLVNLFIDIYRKHVLKAFIWGYDFARLFPFDSISFLSLLDLLHHFPLMQLHKC